MAGLLDADFKAERSGFELFPVRLLKEQNYVKIYPSVL